MNMGEEECWSKLPVDLLEMIDEYVVLYVDKIRFRCVCTNWLSGLSQLPNLRRSQSQPPWLLLPYNSKNSGSLCGLYHPFENKVYEIDFPEAGKKVFKGSDFGWVVTILENGRIYVVNPLSRVRHELPPRYTFPDVVEYRPDRRGNEYLFQLEGRSSTTTLNAEHVRNYTVPKIALSCCPTQNNDFYAVAIYYGRKASLAYCKLGDNKWCDLLEFDNPHCPRRGYLDIIFCNGRLYALASNGELMICDDIVSCPKLRCFAPTPTFRDLRVADIFLINSSSHGLMGVNRILHCNEIKSDDDDEDDEDVKYVFRTYDFRMYKLDMATQSWVQLKSLGSEILFMGLGTQVSDSSQNLRASKGNQIYFASNSLNFNCQGVEDCFDNGIFNFDNKLIDPLGYMCNPRVIWPSPIWVNLNPY